MRLTDTSQIQIMWNWFRGKKPTVLKLPFIFTEVTQANCKLYGFPLIKQKYSRVLDVESCREVTSGNENLRTGSIGFEDWINAFTLVLEQAEFSVFPLNCQGSIGELREDKTWKASETLPARAAQLVLELRHLLFQCPNLYFQTGQERPQKDIFPSLIAPAPFTMLKETLLSEIPEVFT